jgi:hypothetical protein
MRKYWFLLVLASLGCENPVRISEDCHVDEDPDFINAYFNFQVGTRWVYELENSNQKDTVTIYYHSPALPPALNDFIWFAHSSNRGYNYFQSYYSFIHYQTDYTQNECYRNVINSGFELNGQTISHASFLVSKIIEERTTENFGHLSGRIEEFNLNNVIYQDVFVYVRPTDFCFDQDSMRYYISRNYGVVKFENMSNGEVWNLIDSVIIQ